MNSDPVAIAMRAFLIGGTLIYFAAMIVQAPVALIAFIVGALLGTAVYFIGTRGWDSFWNWPS